MRNLTTSNGDADNSTNTSRASSYPATGRHWPERVAWFEREQSAEMDENTRVAEFEFSEAIKGTSGAYYLRTIKQ